MDTSAQIYPTKIYTDGSKVGGKVGAGVAIFSDKRLVRQCKYRLQTCCSNNQAIKKLDCQTYNLRFLLLDIAFGERVQMFLKGFPPKNLEYKRIC
jgi:hypothetical protein